MTNILLDIGPYGPSEFDRNALRQACGNASVVETDNLSPLDNFDGSQIDVLVAEGVPHNLQAWPKLRFIQLLSAGINHLKGHAVWKSDILVANASGTHAVPIAQYVTCTLLMMAHRMPQNAAPSAARNWNRDRLDCELVREQTVGIIGYGSIGRECARQLSALGMQVFCLKRDPASRRDPGFVAWPGTGDPEGTIPVRWFGPKELNELLPLCDVLVLTVPSTDETFDMIGARELKWMKKSAIVINVARGGIINETALTEALRNQAIAGAVVDCFSTEPPPADQPLFTAPNTILTPHMAGVFEGFWPVLAKLLAENLHRHFDGKPILNRVNPEIGY